MNFPQILCITNDFGPRAGGIETFIIGLLERMPRGEVVVYTSYQDEAEDYDRQWLNNYGVEVIRDKSKILLPTPRVIRALQLILRTKGLNQIWFGAAAPLGLSARFLRTAEIKRIVALTHGHEVWWAKIPPFSKASLFALTIIYSFCFNGGAIFIITMFYFELGKLILRNFLMK